MTYICDHCQWGYMKIHGIKYVKCPICGYTEEMNEELKTKYMLLYKNGACIDEEE